MGLQKDTKNYYLLTSISKLPAIVEIKIDGLMNLPKLEKENKTLTLSHKIEYK